MGSERERESDIDKMEIYLNACEGMSLGVCAQYAIRSLSTFNLQLNFIV